MDLVRLRRVIDTARDGRASSHRLTCAVEAAGLGPTLVRYLDAVKGRQVPEDRAVGVLGREAVSALAVMAMFERRMHEAQVPSFLASAIWEDGLRAAGCAVALAEAQQAEDAVWEAASALILQLATVELFDGRPYAATWLSEVRPESPLRRPEAERALFGLTRVDAMGMAAERIGLPPDLLVMPRQALSGAAAELSALMLRQGEDLAWRVAHVPADDARQPWCAEVGLSHGLTDGEMHRVVHDSLVGAQRLASALEAPTPSVPAGWGPDEVAAEPWEPGAVRRHVLAVESALSSAAASLRRAAELDGPTGLPSARSARDEWARRALIARATRRNLWCALVEVDGLVALAAAEGFEAQDRAIAAVGGALSRVVRDGFVGRFSDGAVMVIFEADHRGARVVAERVRNAIAETRIPDVSRRLTATIVAGDVLGTDRESPALDLLHALRRLLVSNDRRVGNRIEWLDPVGGTA